MENCDECVHNLFCETKYIYRGHVCEIFGYEIDKMPANKRAKVFKYCKFAKAKQPEKQTITDYSFPKFEKDELIDTRFTQIYK